jgi:excisionase family DNA binding protein
VSAQQSHGEGREEAPSRKGEDSPKTAFDRTYTLDQAARILGTSSATVRRLIKDDRIAHQRVSARRVVIRESALHAYLERVTKGPCT